MHRSTNTRRVRRRPRHHHGRGHETSVPDYEIGGGAGLLNSKNVPGGQGQNLAFNWFTQAGLRHQLSQTLALTGGVYFTHHSNLGMTRPNPGIDVLGLTVGLVWRLD